MLKAGDELRFGFETADEVRLVGNTGEDYFDGDVTLDAGLISAIYRAIATRAEAFL